MNLWSEEGREGLQECEWNDVVKPWHMHRLDALDMAIEDTQQRVVRDSAEGYFIDEVHGGHYSFEEDEFAISLTDAEFRYHLALSDEDRDMLDYPKVWHDKMRREYNERSGSGR